MRQLPFSLPKISVEIRVLDELQTLLPDDLPIYLKETLQPTSIKLHTSPYLVLPLPSKHNQIITVAPFRHKLHPSRTPRLAVHECATVQLAPRVNSTAMLPLVIVVPHTSQKENRFFVTRNELTVFDSETTLLLVF
jgi:hypothetical protein